MHSVASRGWYALFVAIAVAFAGAACGSSTDSSGVATLDVTPNPVIITRGDSVRLTVSPLDAHGQLVTGISVAFESQDTTLVKVSAIGLVRSVAGAGTTEIRVVGGGALRVVPVTVTQVPVGITLAPADTMVQPGASFQYRARVLDAFGDSVPGQPITYRSSDSTVVRVSATGRATAREGGDAVVTAQSGLFAANATVHVPDTLIVATLPLSARPTFIARTSNIVYVTRVDVPWVKKLDLTTMTFTDSVQAGSLPCGVVFNPAGTRAYVANQGRQNGSVFDVATGAAIATFPVTGDPLPVAISLDGATLFVTTNVNRLYKLNSTTGAVLDSLALPATSHHLFVHPNDSLLYVATRDGGSVLEVRWRTMTIARTFTLGVQTLGMEMAPDRSELYVTSGSTAALYIITLATGGVSSVPVGAGASTIALSADGTRIYVGLLFAGKIDVLDRATRARIRTHQTGGVVRGMVVDPARNQIVVTNESGWVNIIR